MLQAALKNSACKVRVKNKAALQINLLLHERQKLYLDFNLRPHILSMTLSSSPKLWSSPPELIIPVYTVTSDFRVNFGNWKQERMLGLYTKCSYFS